MPMMPPTRAWAGQSREEGTNVFLLELMGLYPNIGFGGWQEQRFVVAAGAGVQFCGWDLVREPVSGIFDMTQRKSTRAVFPGTFDPITHGHLDVIKRAREFVDELIVAVGRNPEKRELFTAEERVEMMRELIGDLPRVRVEAYEGLTAEFVRRVGAQIIVRGIRDTVDLHYEIQQANVNMAVGGVETIFLMTGDQFALISSTYIKQIVELGCQDMERLSRLVPANVAERLRRKYGAKNNHGSLG